MKRVDRYQAEENKLTRVKKNSNTYEEINSKIGYDTIPTYESDVAINLSSFNIDNLKRNEYHKIKDYKDLLDDDKEIPIPKEMPKKVISPKEFDINKVLEEAKKNRITDELEEKRKVEKISTLNSLNKKYLYHKGFTEEDSQDLKELIDTITTKKLSEDIKDEEEKELLSELLATTIDVKLEKELSKEELDKLLDEKQEMTNSFYTKSLDLSEEDLVEEGELVTEEEVPKSRFKIILVLILLFIVFSTIVFILFKHLNII